MSYNLRNRTVGNPNMSNENNVTPDTENPVVPTNNTNIRLSEPKIPKFKGKDSELEIDHLLSFSKGYSVLSRRRKAAQINPIPRRRRSELLCY